MRPLVLALATLPVLGGCLTHRAVVELEPASAAREQERFAAVATEAVDEWRGPSERSSPLPVELPVTVFLRDDTGRLWRADALPQTPRPWWQRFPADLVSDLWPEEFVFQDAVVLVPQPVTGISESALTDEAAVFGYASRVPLMAVPESQQESRP